MTLTLPEHAWRVTVGLLAFALIAVSIPQAIISAGMFRAEFNASSAGAAIAIEQLNKLDIDFDVPDARIRAGLLRLQIGVGASADPQAPAAIKLALDDLRNGLARKPSHALAWLELAHGHYVLGESAQALQAWRMSLIAAYYDPALSLRRIELGLRMSLMLDDNDRQALHEHIKFVFTTDLEQLANLAKRDQWMARIIRSHLPHDERRLDEYQQFLNRKN